MAEDRYFKVRITTAKLAAQGHVLVYVTAIDVDQQKDCSSVCRDHGYDEADLMVVAAIKNVRDMLTQPNDEIIPLSAKEISQQEAMQSFAIIRKKN